MVVHSLLRLFIVMKENNKQNAQELINALRQSTRLFRAMNAHLRQLIEWMEQQEARNMAAIRADNEKRRQFLKVFGDILANPEQE